MTVLIEAIQAGDLQQVQQLVDADPALLGAASAGGVSPVMMAIYYGESAIAELLIARSPSLSLFEAAAAGKVERVRALLDADPASANAYAPDGFQPLGLASFFGHTAVAGLLLERGAAVNSPSRNAQRVMPLHSAVAGQHFALAKLFLEHGADVNAIQEGDFTPLQGAAQNGQIEMVNLLLEHGADKNAKARDGRTALDMARQEGHQAVVALLEPT